MTGRQVALLSAAGIALACLAWFWGRATSPESGGGEPLAGATAPADARVWEEISALKRDNERLRAEMNRVQGRRTGAVDSRAAGPGNAGPEMASEDSAAEARAAEELAAQLD